MVIQSHYRLNPLHCGAVVASLELDHRLVPLRNVSIPFIAGQWSLPLDPERRRRLENQVSIPFIAGQWSLHMNNDDAAAVAAVSQSPSLRGSGRFPRRAARCGPIGFSLNPLHCGAVVASCVPRLRAAASLRLNPLHCGAVVASSSWVCTSVSPGWGLNPLHCGAVVASDLSEARAEAAYTGLNPLHCGAVVASPPGRSPRRPRRRVSIPFIAGQWSLRGPGPEQRPAIARFQSPSLRGSGRFWRRGREDNHDRD